MVPVKDILTDMEQFEEDFIVMLMFKYLMKRRAAKKTRVRRLWVNDYLKQRREKGRFFVDFADMRRSPAVFKENYRMTPDQFDALHAILSEVLSPKLNTRPSDIVSSKEKLAITLEYFASGSLLRHIASVYRVSKQEVSVVIEQTCDAILQTLKPQVLPDLSNDFWIQAASRYEKRWNFPNCIGAVDGKHCAIKCPKNSGSIFYNYKGYHSLVLMAVADADYKFIYFDAGAYGSEGDSGVFRDCDLWKALLQKKLTLPNPVPLYGKVTPYFFVADDAFPLNANVMKPYKPANKQATLTIEERAFNYRLSRARRTVENAFGILCSRWMCLARTMLVRPQLAQKIIAACCVLHNYLISIGKEDYIPTGFSDVVTDDGHVIDGSWRSRVHSESMFQNDVTAHLSGRVSHCAKEIRNHLKDYVNSEDGRLPWQDKAIHN